MLKPARSRLLLLAFCCDPDESMEDRNGWYRALHATKQFDVTVLCGPHIDPVRLERAIPPNIARGRVHFQPICAGKLSRTLMNTEPFFYWGYRLWMQQAYRIAKQLHDDVPFHACHQVTLCGYREPSELWKLSCPFIWGPIGGTSNFPLRFLWQTDFSGGIFEIARNLINGMQLRYSRRIRQAAQQASILIAANSSTQSDLERYVAGRSLRELETGIDFPVRSPRDLRNPDEPLHILWVGRLRSWKGLPILLRALARLPREVNYRLRVVGDGKCASRWRRLAKRLQIDPHIEWLPRPPYRESLQHFEWADVFAFTSLRDTSGAGLLEALAYGVPIIGLHHQGAADIMDAASSVPIPLTNPDQVIADFADALHELAMDSELLKSLSDGALSRAEEYVWENRQTSTEQLYAPFVNGDTVSSIAHVISNKKI